MLNICTLKLNIALLTELQHLSFPLFLKNWKKSNDFNLCFCLRNKTYFPCLHSLVKTEGNIWENSRADQWKPEMQTVEDLHLLENSHKHCQLKVFNRLWRHERQCFISFIKLLFSVLTKRKMIYGQSAYCKFSQLGDSKLNHIAHIIFMLHSAMKTHLLTNQNPCNIQIIL